MLLPGTQPTPARSTNTAEVTSVQTDTITIGDVNDSLQHEPQSRLDVGDLVVKTAAQADHLRPAARAI